MKQTKKHCSKIKKLPRSIEITTAFYVELFLIIHFRATNFFLSFSRSFGLSVYGTFLLFIILLSPPLYCELELGEDMNATTRNVNERKCERSIGNRMKNDIKKSGVALRQFSLTLHYTRCIFYYQHYTHI